MSTRTSETNLPVWLCQRRDFQNLCPCILGDGAAASGASTDGSMAAPEPMAATGGGQPDRKDTPPATAVTAAATVAAADHSLYQDDAGLDGLDDLDDFDFEAT